jgi:RHS repeat-associated protein
MQKQDSSGTMKEVWDLENVLEETDGSDVTQVIYTLGLAQYGELISQRRGSATQFYLFDGLGSTNQLTGSNATVTDSYLYQAFGTIIPVLVASTNPFRFVGREGFYLDSDLVTYWLRARMYDPVTGRFTSRDSLGISRGYEHLEIGDGGSHDPFGLELDPNPYWYVGNNPTNATDPSGEQPVIRRGEKVPPSFIANPRGCMIIRPGSYWDRKIELEPLDSCRCYCKRRQGSGTYYAGFMKKAVCFARGCLCGM